MANKKFYWLKLQHDFFNNKEIKKLRKIAGGDTYVIIYLKLQLLSLKNEGKLYFEGFEDDVASELALDIDEDEENVKVTFMFLKKYGLIEELNNNEFLLPKAVSSIGKEGDSAERVRRFRAKKALQSNTQVTNETLQVTSCNTEKEKRREREEKEIEKEIESSNKFSDGSIELSLSILLYDLVNKNIKTKKPNFANWAKHIDLMLRIDNRTVEDIKAVITWSQNDNFWKSNIRSTKKLREKFETLYLQMNNKSKSYNTQNKESDMEQLKRLYLQMEMEEEANG